MRCALVRVSLILFVTVTFPGHAAAQALDEFGAPFALNTNARSDAGNDQGPQVTTDGHGTWVAVWHSHDSLGDTIGTDSDILVARSTDAGVTWTPPAPLGANGCHLRVSLDVQFLVKTDANGKFVQKLAVPNNRTLKGFKFYNQYGVADASANVFGVTFSNGGAGIIQ